MTQTSPPMFPPEQAFVVQFTAGAAASAGAATCRGRVEHVLSGRSSRFETPAELFDFMETVRNDVMGQAPDEPGAKQPPPACDVEGPRPRSGTGGRVSGERRYPDGGRAGRAVSA